MHVLLHVYVIIYIYPYIHKCIVTNKYRKVQRFGGNNRELSLEGRYYEYIHMLIHKYARMYICSCSSG